MKGVVSKVRAKKTKTREKFAGKAAAKVASAEGDCATKAATAISGRGHLAARTAIAATAAKR